MHLPRIDASVVCFSLVVLAAIPVAALRSRTYALGYELGELKKLEHTLRSRNVELKTQLAATQRSVREKYSPANPRKAALPELELPRPEAVIRQDGSR